MIKREKEEEEDDLRQLGRVKGGQGSNTLVGKVDIHRAMPSHRTKINLEEWAKVRRKLEGG